METGSIPDLMAMPLKRILVEVPIRVQDPPKILAKDNGISKRDGFIPDEFAIWTTMGIKMATTGVLLMNADTVATVSINIARPRIWFFRNNLVRTGENCCKAPVLRSAVLRINMNATVMVAGLLNPATPSSGVSTPVRISAAKMEMATRSMEKTSVTKRNIAAAMIRKTINASGDMIIYGQV